MLDRLFIVVRGDLGLGLAAAQSVHAAFAFAQQHPALVEPWMRHSQFLVIVTVPDEVALIGIASNAIARDIALTTWHEPDLDGQATALALAPGLAARRLCANLPLLGRQLAAV